MNLEKRASSRFNQAWTGDRVALVISDWLLPNLVMRRRAWPLLLGASYVTAIAWLGGLRGDHWMIGLLCLLDYYNKSTRRFLKYFLPFILTGVIYDSMRYFYWQAITGHVHVAEPYFRDLSWFGLTDYSNGTAHRVTPNEFFRNHTFIGLDLICGFAYLVFVGEYLLAAFYLFFNRHFEILKKFGTSFLMVNILGFITYFIYPAAPPWYVTRYGLGPAKMDVVPSAAAAERFDRLLGTHYFDQVYGRGVDVFGAYPSLHVVYPFLTFLMILKVPALRFARIPAALFYLLMCLSAVYLQHHYVVDILLGTTYAGIIWSLVNRRWTRAVDG